MPVDVLPPTQPHPAQPLPALTRPSPAGLARLAAVLATRAAIWQPLIRFSEPRWSTRIAGGEGWEAWLLTWLPGQGTGLHDPGGSAGAITVLAGALLERTPVTPRSPDGEVTLATRRLEAGAGRSFGDRHLHDVQNTGGTPSVSLHVYGPRLTDMTRYRLEPGGHLRVTARERAGEDW